MKKLLLLGGLRYLLPVIEAAHKEGIYVITVDYLPNNIAHKYSDEYHNVSIIDNEAVLKLAKQLKIDGIMSFAVDPGVVTASYVQQEMCLPSFGPYESVKILQNKGKFRKFLADNGFNVPKAKSYTDEKEALNDISKISFPVIVKPTDSAGSKGVTRVNNKEELPYAIAHAIENSLSKTFIIEEFIEKQGYSSDSDCFVQDGKFKFYSFSSQRFDTSAQNPYVPAAYSWPASNYKQTAAAFRNEEILKQELQRLISLLNMQTSIYNIETRISTNGKPYIMEVSPRGGGNRLAEMIRYATGVDMIKACMQASVGNKITPIEQKPYNGYWAEVILHSDKAGEFESLSIKEDVQKNIMETDLWVKKGDKVKTFNGANDTIGTLVMKFSSEDEMEQRLMDTRRWMEVKVKE